MRGPSSGHPRDMCLGFIRVVYVMTLAHRRTTAVLEGLGL